MNRNQSSMRREKKIPKFAELFGVERSTAMAWRKRGFVPFFQVWKLIKHMEGIDE